MKEHQALVHKLSDYQPPAFLVPEIELLFQLYDDGARVTSTLQVRRNPEALSSQRLELNGQDVRLEHVRLNGRELQPSEYQVDDEYLVIDGVPEAFELNVSTWIKPQENTCLEGLYRSGGLFCTQCEAEGFRRITYFPDRPDVLSKFTTTIEAEQTAYPVLLGNGNPVAEGATGSDRHWARWEDPFPKPCYLFALVAGDLVWQEDHFETRSGRSVQLRIYVEPQNREKCDHAMASLKRSMRWDEEVYGREYDLDIFNIVAVDDFNMGAMENKGLNIFNSACVLANPRTATDAAYERIEAIVAHEYFHNWSGNRVTCRDWFQLSLKEGFTVFRDASYTADRYGAAVKRIDDATLMRTAQFAEDAGPMAHPVRPDTYMEISNFYTLTVYEKGAEVVGMIHRLLGAETFRKGSDLYFERFDGQAVTTDDFVDCMEQVSGRDLTQFKRWYSQAGTPRLKVRDEWDAGAGTYQMHFSQHLSPSPGQTEKLPQVIPVEFALFGEDGQALPLKSTLLELDGESRTLRFEGLQGRPVPSLLRDFSAPVKLDYPYTREQLAFLMQNDTDGFARWDATQNLLTRHILCAVELRQAGKADDVSAREALVSAWGRALESVAQGQGEHGLTARLIQVPGMAWLSGQYEQVPLDELLAAREETLKTLVTGHADLLWEVRQTLHTQELENPDDLSPAAIGRRALKNQCLALLAGANDWRALEAASEQQMQARLMTEELAGLSAILRSQDSTRADEAVALFESRWQTDSLVMESWFSVQAGSESFGDLARIAVLLKHPLFSERNPNKVRSVIGAFANQNWKHFHAGDGSGYAFLREWVGRLNALNPQIASRLVTPLTRWRKYPGPRGAQMKQHLESLIREGGLSPDVYEVVSKSLSE